jgi:RNA polymerase sigma-70 factor (ECF subfamily)
VEATGVGEAYEKYQDSFLGYMTSLTRDREDAQDLVHETYVRLAQQVELGRPPRETRAWLYRVGRNLVISRGRRRQVADRLQSRLVDRGATASAEDSWIATETSREIRAALADVAATDRTALLMAAEGFAGAEIARALGISEGAVRTRQCRARARLRSRLAVPA